MERLWTLKASIDFLFFSQSPGRNAFDEEGDGENMIIWSCKEEERKMKGRRDSNNWSNKIKHFYEKKENKRN